MQFAFIVKSRFYFWSNVQLYKLIMSKANEKWFPDAVLLCLVSRSNWWIHPFEYNNRGDWKCDHVSFGRKLKKIRGRRSRQEMGQKVKKSQMCFCSLLCRWRATRQTLSSIFRRRPWRNNVRSGEEALLIARQNVQPFSVREKYDWDKECKSFERKVLTNFHSLVTHCFIVRFSYVEC